MQNESEFDVPVTQDDVKAAEEIEQTALNVAQNKYLIQRVVVLRAQIVSMQKSIQEAREEVQRLSLELEEARREDEVPIENEEQ